MVSLSSSIDSADAKIISDIAKSNNNSKETIITRNMENKKLTSNKTSKMINSSFMSGDESVFNNTGNNDHFIQNVEMSEK